MKISATHSRMLIVMLLALAMPAAAWAQPRQHVEESRLTVRPMREPIPALRWRLLPNPTDERRGNAATMWLMALKSLPPTRGQPTERDAPDVPADLVYELLDTPVSELQRDTAVQALNRYLGGAVYDQLQTAAWRDRCQWDFPWEKGIAMLLPHLNDARWVAILLCVQARLQMAEGDVEGAVRTLQILFALARDLNEEAVLVQGLVGVGIGALGAKQIEELIQQPDAPNLYWALATMPRPYFDLPRMIEMERRCVLASYPALRTLRETGQISPELWNELLQQVRQFTTMAMAAPSSAETFQRLAVPYAIVAYPQAKQYLIDRGMPPQEVEQIGVPTVLARWMVTSYNEVYDEMTKWLYLPAPAQGNRLEEASGRFHTLRTANWLNPLMWMVPSLNRAGISVGRVDQHLAMLQTIEAIRDHAARNDGRLPASLDDVTALPVPRDPMTAKPFEYTVTGNTFILQSPPSPNDESYVRRFEVTVER